MITQKLDSADSILGFTVMWVKSLAARVDHLHVLCQSVTKEPLPLNVTVSSMGKERGNNRLAELREFYRTLNHTVGNVDAIFCHMIPRYAWLSAPHSLRYGKPIFLWYVHRHINLELRLSMLVTKYVMTAGPESFPLPTKKLRVLGHGIDTTFYSPDPNPSQSRSGEGGELPLIVQVARLTPIKHQATLLQAIASIPAVRVMLIGGVPPGHDDSYQKQLQDLCRELGITARVVFSGALTIEETRAIVRRSSVAVNLTPPGSFDKAALESMLMGIPTIVANPAFDPLLGENTARLRVSSPKDVQGLIEQLNGVLAMSDEERRVLGQTLRERTARQHGLDRLMDLIVKTMES